MYQYRRLFLVVRQLRLNTDMISSIAKVSAWLLTAARTGGHVCLSLAVYSTTRGLCLLCCWKPQDWQDTRPPCCCWLSEDTSLSCCWTARVRRHAPPHPPTVNCPIEETRATTPHAAADSSLWRFIPARRLMFPLSVV